VKRGQKSQTSKRGNEDLGNCVGLAGLQRPYVHTA
jgi:hypothetical protein